MLRLKISLTESFIIFVVLQFWTVWTWLSVFILSLNWMFSSKFVIKVVLIEKKKTVNVILENIEYFFYASNTVVEPDFVLEKQVLFLTKWDQLFFLKKIQIWYRKIWRERQSLSLGTKISFSWIHIW